MPVNETISKHSPETPRWLPWSLVSVVSFVAIFVWGHSLAWQYAAVNSYTLFPVLGLLAFSIMWSHYMTGEMRRLAGWNDELKVFFKWTGYAVLALILLHPGILIYQRFRDGFGLPPGSYESYVAPGMGWLTLLGSVSLLAFLSFELKRWFDKKDWWAYVLMANDAAMLAIFYHGLQLGTQTHIMWFRDIWFFYGITLIAVLVHSYTLRIQQHTLRLR